MGRVKELLSLEDLENDEAQDRPQGEGFPPTAPPVPAKTLRAPVPAAPVQETERITISDLGNSLAEIHRALGTDVAGLIGLQEQAEKGFAALRQSMADTHAIQMRALDKLWGEVDTRLKQHVNAVMTIMK